MELGGSTSSVLNTAIYFEMENHVEESGACGGLLRRVNLGVRWTDSGGLGGGPQPPEAKPGDF